MKQNSKTKMLALLLAAMMTLSLAACGSDTGSTDEYDSTERMLG